MKVWEETWRQSEAYPKDVWGACDQSGGLLLFEGGDQMADNTGAARAQLAAAAPEMARLLLTIGYDYPGTDGACMFCDAYSNHEPTCRIGIVLRKAGVIG